MGIRISLGTNADQYLVDYHLATGEIYVYGITYQGDLNLGQNCYLYQNISGEIPFIAEFSSNHTCLWVSSVEGRDTQMPSIIFSKRKEYRCSIAVDNNDELIVTSYFTASNGQRIVSFGDYDVCQVHQVVTGIYLKNFSKWNMGRLHLWVIP